MRSDVMGKARGWNRAALGVLALTLLAGCQEMGGGNLFKAKPKDAAATADTGGSSVRLVERDVEAPEVFQVKDKGLWDGRPSLGGVWVAHPDVSEPERVIIRNTANSKFVIGALFRRERANPGPAFQVSSDAAATLGMLAGAPAELQVTALRREAAPDPEAPDPEADPGAAMATPETLAGEEIETTSLDPVEGAAAAIEAAETADAPAAAPPATAAPAPATAPKPRAQVSSLDRPYLQIGIFSVEQNASNTATAMRQAGMVPTVLKQSSQGKTFWRVIVGPAANASERSALLKKIKGVGFDDAYAVTN